ncbi:MAG TPA: hypothetical protein VK473_01725 [Terriglobales bacterium]|nr:hypothetical protein [Terriglobales bacterium]
MRKLLPLLAGCLLIAFLAWWNYAAMSIQFQRYRYRAKSLYYRYFDPVDRYTAALAGRGFADCGRVPVARDPGVANRCAWQAFNARKNFRVIYDLAAVNSPPFTALVGTRQGAVFEVHFERSLLTGDIRYQGESRRCPDPVALQIDEDHGILVCTPLAVSKSEFRRIQ